MITLDQIKDMFNADTFALHNGITIDEVSEDRVVSSLTVDPRKHFNSAGTAHGAAIFAVIDLAFAVLVNIDTASKETDYATLAQSVSVSYLKPPKGTRLIAEAKMLHKGRRTKVVLVSVTDDQGTKIATATANGFQSSITIR